MVNHNGIPNPIVEDADKVQLGGSEELAEQWAKDSDYAQWGGYTVYEWDY